MGLIDIRYLLNGALWTFVLSLIAVIGGSTVGAAVALSRLSPRFTLRICSSLYIQLVQGTPLLVIMFLTYFGLPAFGVTLSPLIAAGISLTIYVGAYLGEIWRGCLQSVPKPQWEAAEGLALSPSQRMIKVILPQAIRIATPQTVGFVVQVVKSTSLASTVGFIELTRAAQLLNNSLFEPFQIFILVAVMYFVICYPLSLLSRRFEAPSGGRRSRIEVA